MLPEAGAAAAGGAAGATRTDDVAGAEVRLGGATPRLKSDRTGPGGAIAPTGLRAAGAEPVPAIRSSIGISLRMWIHRSSAISS